jgi:NAD(P)-dependent dehydrogenase (short-subunit alcohol dehydrogenase family)
MSEALAGTSVLVTGGSSGLGAAVALAVSRAGGTPAVLDRRPPEKDWLHREVDLSDGRAGEVATVSLVDELGGCDAVVTCAGVDTPAPFGELDGSAWEQIVRVNLFGTAAVLRAALPAVEERRGRFVTVASTLGHRVAGDASAYCAGKWGVVGLTRALCEELKGRVGVTLLTPGGMATAFFDGRSEQYRPPADARLCSPDDVADAVMFALTRPAGCEVKELVVAGPTEGSWP